METKRICPSCQKPLSADVPLGLCPECLIKSGFNTGTDPGNPGKESSFVPPTVEELRTLFPQLEILELIGKGGMGAVYKARQLALDRLVALKILPPGAADDAGFAERFNREARALARLNHPHIVAVHDFGQTGGQPYLVMEFVDGPNLRQVEQAGRLTPDQALQIVPQICEALQFAHNEGVVHRDIKPENILLDKKGRVKITDFGIAKIVGVPAGKVSLTGAKDVLGTPHYMAPEQVEKPATVDHRADIYSLGVVFYELLTGELPLGKFQPPSKKVQVDVRLDEVVLHALEKEPERRYQHVSEVKSDVETIAASPQSKTGGVSGSATAPAPRAFRRWFAPLVVVQAGQRVVHWPGVVQDSFLLAGIYCVVWLAVVTLLSPVIGTVHTGFLVGGLLGFLIAMLAFGFYRSFKMPVKQLMNLDANAPSPEDHPSTVPAGMPLSPGRRPEEAHSEKTEPGSQKTHMDQSLLLSVAAIQSLVKAPGNWLVATGILNWIAIPLVVFVTFGIAAGKGMLFAAPTLLIPLSAMLLSSVIIVAGLKMKRLEAYPLAIIGSILAILVTPGNFIGLPVGIWSLVVLCRREVREAFGGRLPLDLVALGAATTARVSRLDRFWRRFAVAVALVVLAMILIPVGALLLAITLPAFQKARERARVIAEMRASLPLTAKAIRFGPVQEVTLNNLDDRNGNEALSFASGQVISLFGDFGRQSAEGRIIWLNSNRVDLLVDYARDRWALMTRSMTFRDLPNEKWDSPYVEFGGDWPESEVLEKREHRGDTFYLLPTNAQPPLTFAFQTAADSHGVLQITGFTVNPRGMKLRYKLAQLPAGGGGGGSVASADQNAQRKFVRLVMGDTAMTFEGQPTSWEGVSALLAKVLDRNKTVLEFAVTSDQITMAQQNEWFQKVSALARQQGFEYASFIGIHPLGSKGTSSSSAKPVRPSAQVTFGPVITRSVSGEGDARRRFIDFETGRQFAASEFFGPKAEPSPEETQKWWRENSIDAMADTSPAVSGLVGLDMIAVPVPLHEWDMPPARLEYHLAAAKPGTPATMSAKGDLPATFVIQTREGGRGLLQITGFSGAAPGARSVMIRYKLAGQNVRDGEQSARDAAPAKVRPSADQAIVEDLALQILVAIRDKDDMALKTLAVDRMPGWREALPQFALEMRERFQQMRGRPFNLMPTESLVEGDYAFVKCDDPKATSQIYLVLHFVRTDDGWRNWTLRNAPPGTPLAEQLKRIPPASPTGEIKPGR